MSQLHRLEPGKKITLSEYPTEGKGLFEDRERAEKEFKELRTELVDLQRRFYASDRYKLLIVLQALDTGGKDGTIRKVFSGVNPQGVKVTSFKAPSKLELSHDFLWRIHQAVPARGMIGVFNRSHYEDVLVVRVDNLVPEEVWRPRYELINEFEKMLVTSGMTILKFYLHISKEEQQERLQSRIDNPDKNWKFSFDDLEKRKQWDQYIEAYQDMLNFTTTSYAPWYVIPADQKWYRNWVIAQTIVNRLKELDPQFPEPIKELNGLVIE